MSAKMRDIDRAMSDIISIMAVAMLRDSSLRP